KNAVILAHSYQLPEIQDIADYIGDSLGLSRIAADTSADMIVFCGVCFMAETAKILSPDKLVVIPKKEATCPMAQMITGKDVRDLRKKYDNPIIIAYVNTPADVKAEVDVCCTSGNAVKVVKSLDKNREIVFIPDKYLADYAAKQTGYNIKFWNGYCPTHIKILSEHIKKLKKQHPYAKVLVHPECTPDVIALADEVISTAGMCDYASASNANEFIIGTEEGLIYKLQKENPEKKFYCASDKAVCANMKKTHLEDVLWSLESNQYEIVLDKEIICKAQKSVNRMLELV
ncbi:quinolinate synthase NadA, partial [bacterium]|nr:quinolinate synthase NadA [bacterium]